jgi:hypothetical protein
MAEKLHDRVKILDLVSPLEPYLADLTADGDEDHQQHADHAVLDTLSERGSPQQNLRRLGKG